jgi:hypothetical protein
MPGHGRLVTSPAPIKHLLAIGLDRGRLDGLSAMTSPHVNLFITSSPQKALLWTRLESLDLILLRFGPPVEPALDLVQALIEANPAPPILLLVEPEAEAVAHHLTRRQICAAQPASITAEHLCEQVLRLLGPRSHMGLPLGVNPRGEPVGRSPEQRPPAKAEACVEGSPERQTGSRPPAPMQPIAPVQSAQPAPPVQPLHSPPPLPPLHPIHPIHNDPMPAPRRVTVVAGQHEPTPKPRMDIAASTAAPASQAAAPTGWELPFLDQLVIELAHRLKNPLVSIKTFTHLLQERFNDPDFRARFYAIVNNDVIQLNDVVDRLLEFTEFSRPYPKLLTLADELRQAKESIEPTLQGRQVTIQLIAPDGIQTGQAGSLQIHADPTQFRYLLKQLLLDSATTAPAGGHLQIRLAGHPAGRSGAEPSCSIAIDTIMASTAPHLHEWLSLELLLAKNLMERHRGTIAVAVDGAGRDNRRRRVTATFPLQVLSRHDGQSRDGYPMTAVPASRKPTSADRRHIPLSIAFRERRVSPRRQEHQTITFADRRRRLEGEGVRTPDLHDDRPHPGASPPYTPR